MKRSYALIFLLGVILASAVVASGAAAEESHARIVRLSLLQGDVRFTQQFHSDSLTDAKAGWEAALLNLPIRQGYAIATGLDSRSEIEFENGAMAFLSANTVVEFYDLSLYDGSLITRLVLRQGSAIFYVNPARGDYFSVTGGDFSVEANGRARFRLDNFDDGSNVNVEQGHVNVLQKEATTALAKGQSYSVNVNQGGNAVLGRTPDSDDFDKWVSGRIDSVATATAYANQYLNSPDYTSGFADLYNYGSWYTMPGYGYGWQPFGVGAGWCPFSYGSWMWDASIGWNFIGMAPWGWLPYHYGGWVFNPLYGWVWVPTSFGFYGRLPYRPVTGVWVHNGGAVGIVPIHPLDTHGKPPVNLGRGVYTVNNGTVGSALAATGGQKWSTEKNPPRNSLTATSLASTAAPTRLSRTILSSSAGNRAVTVSRDSSIVYDGSQHRFVNNNTPRKVNTEEAQRGTDAAGDKGKTATAQGQMRSPNVPAPAHGAAPAPRANIAPPRPPAGSIGTSHSGGPSGGTATWNAGHSGNSSSSSGATHSSAPSGASTSHSSGGGSSHH
jgi:hypothetical protein